MSIPEEITEYLPHRPPMLLLHELVEAGSTKSRALAIVSPGWPLASEDGAEALLAIELVAQTAGLAKCWRDGRKAAVGLLLGVKQAVFHTHLLPMHAELTIEAHSSAHVGGYRVFDGEVRRDGGLLAEVSLQVMKVEDPSTILGPDNG